QTKQLAKGTLSLDDWNKNLADIASDNAAEALDNHRRKEILPRLHFYVSWQHNLHKEMAQGYKDSGEILGFGICYALSLRWAVDELKQEPQTPLAKVVEQMDIGATKAQDRRIQAVNILRKDNRPMQNIHKKLGIERSSYFFWRSSLKGKA